MKKWLKNLGLAWLTALSLWWAAKEWIAQNNQETNKNVREILGEKKESKNNDSATYMMTAADFGKPTEKKIEKQKVDSLDATQAVTIFNDTINTLIASYGKEGLNEKIHEINKQYPDFENLSEAKQKEIIMEKFIEHKENKSIFEFIWWVVCIMLIIRVANNLSWFGSRIPR